MRNPYVVPAAASACFLSLGLRLPAQSFSVASLEAVEFYRTGSEVPQQFGGSNANCGALLLWTRR